MFLLSSAGLFQNKLFLSGTLLLVYQTVSIQMKNNLLLVLIWVEIVCKDYQQTTTVAVSKERVNNLDMGLAPRKSVFGVSDKGKLKPVSSATETS